MTFSVTVPNANQSPGLFPTQNNTNFIRIKDIINQDHNFTDSFANNQGTHKKVSLINLNTNPMGLPGINSILYTLADVVGASQLWFYNGSHDYQLTPPNQVAPYRIFSENVLLAGTNVTAYPDPGFEYCGTGFSILKTTNTYSYYNLLRSGSNVSFRSDFFQSGGNIAPQLFFSGNDLQVSNVSGITQTIITSLILNRIN